jgi:hypothetical protein
MLLPRGSNYMFCKPAHNLTVTVLTEGEGEIGGLWSSGSASMSALVASLRPTDHRVLNVNCAA